MLRFSSEDYTFLERLPSPRIALPAGFKVKYVGEGGVIKDSKQSSGHWIEIAGSPHCSDSAVYEVRSVCVPAHGGRNYLFSVPLCCEVLFQISVTRSMIEHSLLIPGSCIFYLIHNDI